MDVALIDYGTGNLHSLAKALHQGGATVRIVERLAEAPAARAVVLPGVGAFGAAAERLAAGGPQLYRALADDGLPCLGICLGMQLLFTASEEGAGEGLGLIAGSVRRLRAAQLPQMGWNDVLPRRWDPLFGGTNGAPALDPLVAYYANSFVAAPDDEDLVLAWSEHEGDRFPAVVRQGRAWGVQFHPEKSGAAGLRLIRNFLAAAGSSKPVRPS